VSAANAKQLLRHGYLDEGTNETMSCAGDYTKIGWLG
jgi:hypothetical protein